MPPAAAVMGSDGYAASPDTHGSGYQLVFGNVTPPDVYYGWREATLA